MGKAKSLNPEIKRTATGQYLPGYSGNPFGGNTPQKRYINKLQTALDLSIDKLGTLMKNDGSTAMAELIAQAMKKDIVGTLHKLSPFFPKNINLDVHVHKEINELDDEELEAIIMERRRQNEKDVTPDPDPPED